MKKKSGLFGNQTVFFVSLGIAVFIIIFGFYYGNVLENASNEIMSFVSTNFGWLYIISIFFFCVFLIWLAFSKYGNIKLGADDAQPEYSRFHWCAMLFCGGTGIGLVFWSIAEPLSHFVSPPSGIVAGTEEAANFSIRTCFLHWGITQWVCFAIVGLGLAYLQFRKKKKALISSLISPLIGENATNGVIGKVIDIFAVVVSFAGVATSLGLGVSQICGGLNFLFGIPNEKKTWLIVIVVITCVFLVGAISGLKKGMKLLSSINTYLAFLLLALGIIVGPHIEILNTLVNGIGQHIQNFIGDVLMISPFGDNTWIMNWRVFYYAWFIAWTPFVGMFIARISKGRTIREFIIGVVFVPTVFTIIWLSVFGAIALNVSGNWSLTELAKIVASPETAVFIIFNRYPLSSILSLLVIALLAIFFITSADSATFALGMMTSNGKLNPPEYKKVIWAVTSAAIAYVLLSVGSLKPLQTISIAASLPFLFIMIAMVPALVKELRKEKK